MRIGMGNTNNKPIPCHYRMISA